MKNKYLILSLILAVSFSCSLQTIDSKYCSPTDSCNVDSVNFLLSNSNDLDTINANLIKYSDSGFINYDSSFILPLISGIDDKVLNFGKEINLCEDFEIQILTNHDTIKHHFSSFHFTMLGGGRIWRPVVKGFTYNNIKINSSLEDFYITWDKDVWLE